MDLCSLVESKVLNDKSAQHTDKIKEDLSVWGIQKLSVSDKQNEKKQKEIPKVIKKGEVCFCPWIGKEVNANTLHYRLLYMQM